MRIGRIAGAITLALTLALPTFTAGAVDGEVVVATDPLNDWADDPDLGFLGGPLGIDVTELAIRPAEGAVEFVIRVQELLAPPPGEVIRHLWQFSVDGREYWVQAKTSDAASGTTFVDDPVGAVTHLDGSFRLRGDCQIIGIISTCVHVMWIDGEFDAENNEVRMRVPLNDERAPAFTDGAEIGPDPDGMTASVQVAISNNSTSDNVEVNGFYTI